MQPLSQDKQSSKRQSTDTLGESSQLKKVKRSKSSCKSVNLVLGSSNSCYDLRSLVVAQSEAEHLISLLQETLSSAADEGKKSTAVTASSSTGTASASSPTAPSSSSSSSSSGVKRLLYFGVNETVKAVASAKCQLIALTNPSSTHLQFALIDVCREARVPLILVPDLCRLKVPGISRITAIGVKSDAHLTHPIVTAFTKLVTPYARDIFSDKTDDSSCHLAGDASTSKLDSSTSASITDSFESVVASLKSQGKGQTASKRKRDKKKPN